jgi:hypothetical protein
MRPEAIGPNPAAGVGRTLAPTMLIGIGGTGVDVLMRVRRQFFERYGTTGFPIVGYLALDTDSDSFSKVKDEDSNFVVRQVRLNPRGEIPEAIDCAVTQAQFEDYFATRERQHPHIFRWLLPEMNRYGSTAISRGAGQNRPFGRLGFFHHFATIKKAMRDRIAEIVQQASLPHKVREWLPDDGTIDTSRLEVVFIYSLAGGTGAGMFLDAGMLARHLVQRELDFRGQQLHFTHYAVLPDSFLQHAALDEEQKVKIQENTFACLREMEYFSMRNRVSSQTYDLTIPPPVPDEDAPPLPEEPLYRAQWERRGSEIAIESAPWDTCYLVGGGNNLMMTSLKPADLNQMIAERLFLDFDANGFGACRHPFNPNLLERTLTPMDIDVTDEQGGDLYRYRVSRRFSVFGLSQIYFDRARMRRAAGYWLASRLIGDWWLRAPGLSPGQVRDAARQDLLGNDRVVTETHEDGDSLLSLSYDSIRDQVLLEERLHNKQKTYWTTLKTQIEGLRHKIEDGECDPLTQDPLSPLLKQHEAPLDRPASGDPGVALKTFRRNRDTVLPEVENRVRALFLCRLRQHGVRCALQFFHEYVGLMQNEVGASQEKQAQVPGLGEDWKERLRDARKVPWPYARPAAKIELLHGLKQLHRYLAHNYHHKAVPDIRLCLQRALRCVSGREDEEGSYHGLLKRFAAALDSQTNNLEGAKQYLRRHFEQLSREDSTQTRTIGLLARWDDEDRDRRYEELVRHLVPINAHDQTIDWPELEAQVLAQMRQRNPAWAEARSLGGLALCLLNPGKPEAVSQQDVEELARDLAECCESLLRGFARDINALARFDEEPKAAEKKRYLDTLHIYSQPLLFKNQGVNLPPGANTPSIVLLGMANPTSARAVEFRNQVMQSSVAGEQGLGVVQTFDTSDDSIILYQEKAGIPLCYYGRLDTLGEMYTRSSRLKETHFDYPALKGKLPEIRQINQRRHLINCVETTLFAIMTGVLRYEQKRFILLHRQGLGTMPVPVGGHYEDVIRLCGEKRELLEEMQDQFREWREHAAAENNGDLLGILWCATQDLYEEISRRREAHVKATDDPDQIDLGVHPLLSILGKRMLPRLETWLRGLGDRRGERWLDLPLNLQKVLNDRMEPGYRQQMVQQRRDVLAGCYEPIDEKMPIPVLDPDARLREGFEPTLPAGTGRRPSASTPLGNAQ